MIFNVYRFKNKEDKIIYVGKTKNGMDSRMKIHFSKNGHLDSTCYKEVNTIEYIKLNSQIDMDIKELYYINKYKPKYNTISKYDSNNTCIDLSEDEWLVYQLNKGKSKRKSKWIDLNDEQPKYYQQIIAYTNEGIIIGIYHYHKELDMMSGGRSVKFKYWMPLPKEPKDKII